MVGVEVSGSTSELGCHRTSLEHLHLFVETICEDHDFLAQTGWRSRLTVGLGEHRHVFPLLSIGLQLLCQFLNLRDVDLVEGILDGERHGCVVNILRCESEVNELLVFLEISEFVELFLDIIFHGLHVVVGYLLDILDARCALLVKLAVYVAEAVEMFVIEVCQLWQRQFAKRYEIFDFHTDAVFYQSIL